MKLRVARHTKNLSPMIGFYTEVIGLERLGGFENHDRYDGVFLGLPNENWEIEFTVSDEMPGHTPDEDDLLVFYFKSRFETEAVIRRAINSGILPVKAKNPYWHASGMTLPDPDGFLVTLALRSPKLDSDKPLSKQAISLGIPDWDALLDHVRNLPYGRNANRHDLNLVLSEAKGSCSSKHALLKAVADESGIDAKLMVGIYKMNRENTRGIGKALENSGLEYVPEAHCYLKFGQHRYDFTNPHSDVSKIEADLLDEIEITPSQVADFKVDHHKDFIKKWISDEKIPLGFDSVWKLRERCIEALSENKS